MNASIKPKQFPLPSSLQVLAGTERAQAAYPYYMQFSADDDERFWFYNSMHFPEPMSAFDMVTAEAAYCALGSSSTRVHCIPTTLGIDHRIFQQYDLHVHVPAGAVPKDGPSAGITMLTSLASIFTQRKVKSKMAMTGEITLRGKVLPVGGIKEKILAAKRSGIKEIVMSSKNRRDILEIEKHYVKGLTFRYVDTVDEVLKVALLKEKVKEPLEFVLQEAKLN